MVQSLRNADMVEKKLGEIEDPAEKEVLSQCLKVDRRQRWTAAEALAHHWFGPDNTATVTQSEGSPERDYPDTRHHTNIRMFFDSGHTDD